METTVVIEACKSGTVGETLRDSGWCRAIFASAGFDDDGTSLVSYGDVDESVQGKSDPNPADAGSETKWGYVEAFGTAAADSDGDGVVGFDEAVAYAKANDVTEPGRHTSWVWSGAAPSGPVHGSQGTSPRGENAVVFLDEAGEALSSQATPLEVKRCTTAKGRLELSNEGPDGHRGALAVRVFRWDPGSGGDPTPTYFPEDGLRTTVMIPSLGPGESRGLELTWEIPSACEKGEEIHMFAAVDTAQKPPAAIQQPQGSPTARLDLEVTSSFLNPSCWW